MAPYGLELSASVQFVRGVGPFRAAEFARLGIVTVGDLLEHFPLRHDLKPRSIPIGDLELGHVVTVVGEFAGVRIQGLPGRQIVYADVVDGTGRCRVRWFNSPFLRDQVETGRVVRLTGKIELHGELARFTNPQATFMEHSDPNPLAGDRDEFEPVYPATTKLPSKQIHRILRSVLPEAVELISDFVPEDLRAARGLPPRHTAILRIHHPTNAGDVPVARRRLAYDELLLCQIAVQMSRKQAAVGPRAAPILVDDAIDDRIRRRFPFPLTPGQNRAIHEIRADLARPEPMNRLLQADVGAGKTAVAVYASLAAVAKHRQVALLAPTEVLAAQHHAKITRYLAGSRVRLALLTGSTTRSNRVQILHALQTRQLDWLIGTHALLEEDVAFADLGLLIVDEQHRFGVAQRARARRKGAAPHVLVLTATPIPRTLAMTYFGDLDVSTIHDAPPGRQPIDTRLVPPDRVPDAWTFLRSRLDRGEQAYIVYPLVDESDALPLRAATTEARRLAQTVLKGHCVSLLHGRMRSAQKEEIMGAFREGSVKALVATTVIEVGVDVPNATVMAVQHAERFGLSQLHQLRGRVGRGGKKSFCLLFSDAPGESSLSRLKILCQTTDGFRIAEEDLKLRGPGELLGVRQHGMPLFKIASLLTDLDLLTQARDDAATLLARDPRFSDPRHAALRQTVERRYGAALGLLDVA